MIATNTVNFYDSQVARVADSLKHLRISCNVSDLQIKFIILRQKASSVFGAMTVLELKLQEEQFKGLIINTLQNSFLKGAIQ